MVKSMEEKKAIRVQKPQALACPRCNSSHTKFCYYNNYNLSQPRYFCKTCRRYWTAGGSLRNVPVGGGSRKNKRSSPKINHHSMIMPQPSSSNLVSQNLNHEQITPNTHGAQDHQLMAFFKSGGNDYARGTSMMMMNTCLDVFHNNNSDQDNDRIIRAVSSTTATAPSTSARLFFPMEDLKPAALASTSENHQVQAESTCNAYGVDHTYYS